MNTNTALFLGGFLALLILLSGCASVSMGDLKPEGLYGSASSGQQELIACLMTNHRTHFWDPRQVSSPEFQRINSTSLIFTSRLVNETPVDDIARFNTGMPRVYYWAFYEGCQPGDAISMDMYYEYSDPSRPPSAATPVIILHSTQTISGQYGPIYGSVQQPDAGWMPGRYDIVLKVTRGSNATPLASASGGASTTDGATETRPLPCQDLINPGVSLAPGAPGVVAHMNISGPSATPAVSPSATASRTPLPVKSLVLKTTPTINVSARVPALQK